MTWRRAVSVATIGATLLLAASQAGAQCEGDIDGDNQVTVDEIIRAVNKALSGCDPPVSILGVYEGPGYEIHTGCMNPGDEGTFAHPRITTDIDEQAGSLYTGTLTLRRAGGEPFVQRIEGSVDSAGITQGVSFIPGVPFPAGSFSGRLVGKILSISVTINDPTCESAAASFIGTRD